jgi:hypothetical protein
MSPAVFSLLGGLNGPFPVYASPSSRLAALLDGIFEHSLLHFYWVRIGVRDSLKSRKF